MTGRTFPIGVHRPRPPPPSLAPRGRTGRVPHACTRRRLAMPRQASCQLGLATRLRLQARWLQNHAATSLRPLPTPMASFRSGSRVGSRVGIAGAIDVPPPNACQGRIEPTHALPGGSCERRRDILRRRRESHPGRGGSPRLTPASARRADATTARPRPTEAAKAGQSASADGSEPTNPSEAYQPPPPLSTCSRWPQAPTMPSCLVQPARVPGASLVLALDWDVRLGTA